MNAEVDTTKMQALMDAEYARWQLPENRELDQEDFYRTCTSQAGRIAVIIGNLNYQVENGGWAQWVFNGYANAARPWLVNILNEINTEASKSVLGLVREVFNALTWNNGDGNAEYDFDDQDTIYYEISDRFVADVAAYIDGL